MLEDRGAEVAEDVGGIFVSVDVTRSERASKSGHNPAKLSEHVLPRGSNSTGPHRFDQSNWNSLVPQTISPTESH
jgi:hypothetical protein